VFLVMLFSMHGVRQTLVNLHLIVFSTLYTDNPFCFAKNLFPNVRSCRHGLEYVFW
jgi:hypothetical protein